MPPRYASSLPASLVSCQTTRCQPSQPLRVYRQFSQSSCHRETARRREMYAWLNGPGAQLKDPLPGSTNYLGAYDKYGNLARAGPNWQRRTAKNDNENNVDETKAKDRGQEQPDELEMSVRREEEQRGEKDINSESGLPPENLEDLRPFPLNKYFRSQPVLSEELREAIYKRVVNEGASVSLASVEFGVSNERVGAVVRLKQLEKQWIAEVCYFAVLFCICRMMKHCKIRLVFKTPTWLQNNKAMLFLKIVFFYFFKRRKFFTSSLISLYRAKPLLLRTQKLSWKCYQLPLISIRVCLRTKTSGPLSTKPSTTLSYIPRPANSCLCRCPNLASSPESMLERHSTTIYYLPMIASLIPSSLLRSASVPPVYHF